jgi:hypothetical protein
MPAAGVITLILVLVTVAVLAASLIRVALLLKHVNFTLGTVIAGVRAIELATRPINPVLGDIAGDLAATQQALDGLLASKSGRRQKPAAQKPAAQKALARSAPAPSAPEGNSAPGTGPLLVSRLPRRKD